MKKYVVLVLVLMLPVLFVASGAFTSTSAQRQAEISLAGDLSALLSLAPSEGPNGTYFVDSDGDGAYELDIMAIMEGVNTNAITVLEDVFSITNNGTQTVTVAIEAVGDHPEALTFGDLMDGIELGVGSSTPVSIVIDTYGLPAGENILRSLIISATGSQGSPQSSNNYAPVLSVIDDRLFDEDNVTNIVGTTTAENSPFDWSKSFDGDDDYVTVPNEEKYNPTQALTLEAWVRWDVDPETGDPWANIINKSEHQYQLQHSGYTSDSINKYFEFALETENGRKYLFSTTSPVAGEWYHIVATYSADAQEMRIYVNGELESSRRQTGQINVTDFDINIGRHVYDYRYYQGSIAEVAVYDRALSADEIAGITARYYALLI